MGEPAPRVLGGRYELGDTLGYGGMADVYRAVDTRLDRTVAVKLLRSDLARDPAFRARFRREAQASASLNHPSIVQVFDTGEEDTGDGPAKPYIVMELVEGRTLRAVLEEQGRLPLQEALLVTADVCAALHYSHERGLVHRDVKPGNVMVSREGDADGSSIKVMDFGIARAATSSSTMTATAAVLGTAQYLSPEQARGEDVDARSDVYSTGCLLYELVTGRPPFTGDSPVAVAYQQVREDPLPPSSVLAEATPAVDAVVLHAMAKNPDNRYGSASEMREDLLRAAHGRPVHAPPVAPPLAADAPDPDPSGEPTTVLRRTRPVPPPPTDSDDDRSRRGVLWAVAALALLALLIGAVLLVRQLAGPPTERTTVPSVEGLPLAEATETIEANELRVGDVRREFSERPVDEVLQQTPGARTAQDVGTAVDLVVSDGPEQVTVPRLVGLSRQEAEAALRSADLALGEVTSTDAVAPAGQVRASDPEEGTSVDRGSTVDLVVASGEVPVPDVVGEPAAQAAATLGRQGFEVAQVEETTDEAEPGIVIGQDPDGGDSAAARSTVTIVVAVEPAPSPSPTRSPSPSPTARPTRSPSPSPSPTGGGSPAPTPSVSPSLPAG